MNDQALLPIKEGDDFMIGPYRYTCIRWENGRIIAHNGVETFSISIEVSLYPGFKILGKQDEVIRT